jgi:hypothetical protein
MPSLLPALTAKEARGQWSSDESSLIYMEAYKVLAKLTKEYQMYGTSRRKISYLQQTHLPMSAQTLDQTMLRGIPDGCGTTTQRDQVTEGNTASPLLSREAAVPFPHP